MRHWLPGSLECPPVFRIGPEDRKKWLCTGLLHGGCVAFAVYVTLERGAQQVFSTYIDPKHNEADRHWHPHTVDLSAYAGQTVTLIFETSTGPAGDYRYDWAGWGRPRLLEP